MAYKSGQRIQKSHKRKPDNWFSSNHFDGDGRECFRPQGPKKQKFSNDFRDQRGITQPAASGEHGRQQRSTFPASHRRRQNNPIFESCEIFVRKCFEKPPEQWNPDNLCIFLAQNTNHLGQILMECHVQNREISDRLIYLLRTAFLESSLLSGSCRWQMMNMLKRCAFFESRSIVNIVKSLVAARYRHPDESDMAVANLLLDVMKTMIEAGVLLNEDTIVFLGSLQSVLRTGKRIIVKGEDLSKSLMERARSIEDSQFQRGSSDKGDEKSGLGSAKSTAVDLPPILPNISDIRNRRHTALAPRNVIEQFSSATEYVRYIFMSFREDFVGPLCKGIDDYINFAKHQKKHPGDKKHKFWNQDVRLYENVKVLDTALSNESDIDVTIQIDASRFRNFNSRLVYGSLVCLLWDECQSVIYAVVSDSDKETLKRQGILSIHLLDVQRGHYDHEDIHRRSHGFAARGDPDESERMEGVGEVESVHALVNVLQGHHVTMLESTAFYTSYVHSLLSLESLHSHLLTRQSSLPFKKQLLHMSKDISAPRYLEASSGQVSFMCMKKYGSNENVRCLQQQLQEIECTVSSHRRQLQSKNAENRNEEACKQLLDRENELIQDLEEQEKLLEQKYRCNKVSEPRTWPTAADLGLDDSQYAALRQALTREVVLIQGPPGTGKTTLGIRIAELLLENDQLWRRDENGLLEKTPMLLLSYTNHALDQFLTELLRLPVLSGTPCHYVVRVGSRSEQQVLSEHNITKLRHTQKADGMDLRNEKRDLEELKNLREELDQQIQNYKDGIVHHDHFLRKCVMADVHHQSLISKAWRKNDAMQEWLCLYEDDFGQSLNQDDTYLHGSSFETKKTDKGKDGHHHKSKSRRKRYSSSAGHDAGNKARNVDGDNGESADVMKFGDEDKRGKEKEGEASELNIDDELLECEEEMDLEEENERKLYMDDFSDEETESTLCEQPSTSTFQENETTSEHNEWERFSREEAPVISITETFDQYPPSLVELVASKVDHEVNNNKDAMARDEAETVRDVWCLDMTQRWRLYRFWLQALLSTLQNQRQLEENEFRDVSKRRREQRCLTDLRIMKKARLVAMTTTGAARNAAVLQELGPRIVLVEEAAQVPEAHLLSALSPACQHLVMIGDHQQLRPSYNNYGLTAGRGRHHIDISLFERLCQAGVPFQCLALQHRMQPDISSLLVPTIYPELKDHPSVGAYPKVKGVKATVFFLTHSEPEDSVEESKSKRNTHEAQFLASLYLYLRLQGYSERDITVLATYKDQVLLLKTLIKQVEKDERLPPQEVVQETHRGGRHGKPSEKVMGARVAAVDNFQGEESRIVLLSLVRSNKKGVIGYLKEDNRVCVALSRAKEGLFVIGNCTMLSKASPQCWKPILEKAEKGGCVGPALPLYCKDHDCTTLVSNHTDIDQKCTNGGCSQRCDYRRRCGHTCDEMCHTSTTDLHRLPCAKPCLLSCPSGHPCGDICGKSCPMCPEKYESECPVGHPCSKTCGKLYEPCESRCEKKLPCGHQCQSKCGGLCTCQCKEMVKVLGVCGHEFSEVCYMKQEERTSCRVPCGAVLECGHPCAGKCGTCFASRLHVACEKSCKRLLVCRHECNAKCTQSCPPCRKQCEAKCVHSKRSCNRRCGEECQKCKEPCKWYCRSKMCRKKYRCSKLCWEMCDRPRCQHPCTLLHKCMTCKDMYKCRGLYCEDNCPPACPRCNADIFEPFFGDENEPDARFYKMADCKCVVEVEALDRYMDMMVAAQGEEEGDPGKVGPVVCPKCSSPVRTALRYGNVLKKTQADIEQVKRRLLATDPAQLKKKQRELQVLLCSFLFQYDLRPLVEKTKRIIGRASTMEDLKVPENQISFLQAITRLRKEVPVGSSPEIKRTCLKVERHLEGLQNWVMEHRSQFFSDQQLTQFQTELVRTELTVSFAAMDNQIWENWGNDPEKAKLRETTKECLQRLLSNPKVLTVEEEKEQRQTFTSLKEQCSLSGLGISEKERIMVVKTMGFQKGHWFKCKNGHIYCIGDCGGAMLESRCPDCGEGIGGGSHRLRDDNVLAPEMDGAGHAAWSEQANLANYQI